MSESWPRSGDAPRIYDVDANDPDSRLIDRSSMDADSMRQIGEIMAALHALRTAEERLSEASLAYMKLGRNDMRAIHFLIVTGNSGAIATPGQVAAHLSISTASTTKLLDRLERAGHITRSTHPDDRRAIALAVTPSTREAAIETVGRQQAKRFHAAARLTPSEREVVARFITDMARELDVSGEAWASGGGAAEPGDGADPASTGQEP